MPFLIVRNDITKMYVDAIVNAANSSLLGGGGVDGQIHRAAGPQLLEECKALGGCATGEAKITKGYNLPSRYVIHTVGPRWVGGIRNEKELLASCYRRSLEVAKENNCRSVAFPLISSGIYGYPKDQALRVAIDTITGFLFENEMLVYLVVFDNMSFSLSAKLFEQVESYIDENYVDEHSDSHRRMERRRLAEMHCINASDTDYAPVLKMSAPVMPDWDDMLKELDDSFSQALLKIIDSKNLTDPQVYKKANIDRKHFSKIKNNKNYKPEKTTALAFAIALELDIHQTKDLLAKAGLALSKSNKFDVVVSFFIENRLYDIFEINEVLFSYDLPLIGG